MANVDLNKSGRTEDGGDGVLATMMKQANTNSYKFNKRPVVGNGGGGGSSGVNVAKVPNRDDCDQPGSTRNPTLWNAVDTCTVYTRMQEAIDRQNRVVENDLKAKQLHIDSQQKSIENLSSALNAVKDELERKDKRMDQMTKSFIDQIQRAEQRIKALEGARVKQVHEAASSSYVMDLENKMEKYVKQLITDGFNCEKDVAAQESKYLKIQNALQAEKLRIIEDDERKMNAVVKSTDPVMTQPSSPPPPPCNCQNELHALKAEFDRFKSERTTHAKMGFVANGQNERNYMFLRKYDKLKARLTAIEREVTCKNSSTTCDPDLVSTIVRTITTAMNSSSAAAAVTGCCGGVSGRPRGVVVEPEPTTSGQTAPPTNDNGGGGGTMKDAENPVVSGGGGGPVSNQRIPPPPPPPPPPMAPKTSDAKDVVNGSNKTYERYAISKDLLNTVTLAKKGEPVKKIKLPPGVVIVRRKTVAASTSGGDVVAAASTSTSSVSPAESRPITPPPAPPLPAGHGSFCPPPAPPLPAGHGSFCPPPAPPLPTTECGKSNMTASGITHSLRKV